MKIKDIFSPSEVCTCTPQTTWSEAARLLTEKQLPAVAVIDGAGSVVGVLSEKDLFRALFPLYKDWMEAPQLYSDLERMEEETIAATQRTVSEIMSSRTLTAGLDTPVLKVGALMSASGIHQVPVVEDGKLIGMIGRKTIYHAILSRYFTTEN
jgi:CBS domain-containing protein